MGEGRKEEPERTIEITARKGLKKRDTFSSIKRSNPYSFPSKGMSTLPLKKGNKKEAVSYLKDQFCSASSVCQQDMRVLGDCRGKKR